MNTVIISNENEIEKWGKRVNELADTIGSHLPFHRIQMPHLWWKHFFSDNGIDFGSRRGRNFLGDRSWLEKPCFIIIEDNMSICGIAPLFFSRVIMRGSREPVKVLSFVPDSVSIFYQDILVHPINREKIIEKIFECVEPWIRNEKVLMFLGHIPENSPNIKHIDREINLRLRDGLVGGGTTNCWREGLFSWNISKCSKALQYILRELAEDDLDLSSEIKDLMEIFKKNKSVLGLFEKTRKELEKRVIDIATGCQNNTKLSKYSRVILELFNTKPILYPYLNLPRDTESLYSGLSASKRYFYRRYIRKFADKGGVFENIPPGHIKVSDIKEYLFLHSLRWGNESAAICSQTERFHEELCLSMARSGYFRLFFARYKGERIAALSCFDIGGRREYYYAGRSLKHTELRAGKLIVFHSILDAIEKGFKIYDFGYGGDEYKFDFTTRSRVLKSFILANEDSLPDLNRLFPMYEKIVLQ